MRRLRIAFFLGVLGAALLAAAGAQAQSGRFPSSDPDPRVGTPNDPDYDCSEPDDEDADVEDCPSIYDEQFNLFGFAPASTRNSARYAAGPKTGAQISGVSADIAWKSSIGSPSVPIAIQDTGIRWDNASIRRQIWLNVGELPRPQGAISHDADGDGAVTVDDWAGDPRVDPAQNDT